MFLGGYSTLKNHVIYLRQVTCKCKKKKNFFHFFFCEIWEFLRNWRVSIGHIFYNLKGNGNAAIDVVPNVTPLSPKSGVASIKDCFYDWLHHSGAFLQIVYTFYYVYKLTKVNIFDRLWTLFCSKWNCSKNHLRGHYITFTFNHLADAFIQSDVQMRRTIEAIRPSREQQYTSALTSLS